MHYSSSEDISHNPHQADPPHDFLFSESLIFAITRSLCALNSNKLQAMRPSKWREKDSPASFLSEFSRETQGDASRDYIRIHGKIRDSRARHQTTDGGSLRKSNFAVVIAGIYYNVNWSSGRHTLCVCPARGMCPECTDRGWWRVNNIRNLSPPLRTSFTLMDLRCYKWRCSQIKIRFFECGKVEYLKILTVLCICWEIWSKKEL